MTDKVPVLAPYLPSWTGGKFYVDPLNNIFPFENLMSHLPGVAAENGQ